MDYRKPVVFGQNWSASRYRVLPYFAVEKRIMLQPEVKRILEVGCANGWNMSRFSQYGRTSVGLDMVPERVRLAASHGDVMLGSGLELPAASESFDVVYIQHVLHHIGDIETALAEARRVLRPGGYLFLIETIEDSPLIKWGRRLYPHWMGDEINAPFTFEGIRQTVVTAGFDIEQSARYSVLFWMWEILPDQYPAFEKLTPLAVRVEEHLARTFKAYSAHCYLVARK